MKLKLSFLFLALAIGIAAQTGTATVTLSWADTINAAGTGYNVRRGITATACTPSALTTDTCTLLNATPLAVKTFVDTPAMGSTYYYYVRAVNSLGESGNSNVSIATLIGPSPVNVTCSFTVTNGTAGAITCK